MLLENKIWIGDADGEQVCILPQMASRHGLIAGATGTGKTTTLRVLAEGFSDMGVPVFLADIKGDLSGVCRPGVEDRAIQERIRNFGLDELGFQYQAYPTAFWDIFGQGGIPLRTTISEMGPLLLSKILDLNATQTDILNIVFQIADDQELLLIDSKDLKAMLQYAGENNKELSSEYGNIPKQSVNAILRGLVALEGQGAEQFFGEPALNINDWFASGTDGRGMINLLDCRTLANSPEMYSAFLLWMLSELFETLPEVGDLDRPRMVYFFDEAHLLFKGLSKVLEKKIEQVVKLIRSRGVGVYFITQSPRDIPDGVLSQLGNKIQHALRAYTPSDERAVKAAADSFRPNPSFNTKEALTALGTGEALISVLDSKGIPGMVKNCKILPPQSFMGPVKDQERKQEILKNNLYLKYSDMEDRDSAYEFFQREKMQDMEEQQRREEERQEAKEAQKRAKEEERLAAKKAKEEERESQKRQKVIKSQVGRVAGTAAGTIGREVGNNIGKQFGGSFGKRLGGNLGAALGRSILGTFLKFK